jgi:hypothetical protein
MTIAICILAFVVGLLVGLAIGIKGRTPVAARVVRYVEPKRPDPIDGPRCTVCGAPANPVRFHDGRYLCPVHKARA